MTTVESLQRITVTDGHLLLLCKFMSSYQITGTALTPRLGLYRMLWKKTVACSLVTIRDHLFSWLGYCASYTSTRHLCVFLLGEESSVVIRHGGWGDAAWDVAGTREQTWKAEERRPQVFSQRRIHCAELINANSPNPMCYEEEREQCAALKSTLVSGLVYKVWLLNATGFYN